ncbi:MULTISPECIES: DUF4837 family protein [Polaribacter]|uniref:DUF4837 domain-containing protein n=1 Tax=Polaribacter butkevichii TaxID=218490 RepID=A0A2P6C7X1_9FLAO|nr:DUF4837 family protein [Polaribacter butkevichii]PQJ69028.1 DUF4837 domain-containing protein [Polaribacter butkevichii]
MKNIFTLFAIVLLLTSCGGNEKITLRSSVGKVNKVMVVTKASDWNGDIGKEIRNSFGELMVGLPQPESLLSVSQVAPNGFGNMMKVGRNIMIIGVGDEEQYYVKKDVYAQPQTIVYVYAKDRAGVVKMFKKHEKEIIKTFIESDISMVQHLFAKHKLDDSQFKTLQNLGISLTINKNFNTVDDTGDFLWLRQHLSSGIAKTGSNNILVYSVPLEDETKVADSIVAVRNRIGKKYIPGSDPETMHMITEKAYTPFTFDAVIDGKKAYETRGKWEVKNDFMAGPFLNYTVVDKKNNRLVIFEGFTYAPSVNKRAFLFELEAIAKSMKIK